MGEGGEFAQAGPGGDAQPSVAELLVFPSGERAVWGYAVGGALGEYGSGVGGVEG